jgi:hypothetical protein
MLGRAMTPRHLLPSFLVFVGRGMQIQGLHDDAVQRTASGAIHVAERGA